MRTASVLLALVSLVAAKCGSNSDCQSCAGAKDGLLTCIWCVSDGACHSKLQTDCPAVNKITHEFDCPIYPDSGYEYVDNFAREIVLRLAVASNADGGDMVQKCLDKVGAQFFNQYTEICDNDKDYCSGYTAYSAKDNAIILSFRGSKQINQFLEEGVDFIFNKVKAFNVVGGKVDEYFFNGFTILFNAGMESDLKKLIVAHPGAECWITGHSLGGAMASLASGYVVTKKYFPPEKVKLMTFGQPRTGDITYAEAHDNLVKYRYRVIHANDPVPHQPSKIFDNLFNSPFHHRFEVWYNNSMEVGANYSICSRADDNDCSNTVQITDVNAHNLYFGKDLSKWHESGCL